ncbi:unnamed protein product [Rhizoctonia solani]|uniref:Uncharacterized protein n=1 Tax=Rhizoctonia solani TaxID=456999 RepID=A0A8H3AEL4_9AGAM|nr:unnamed protein product [Rhizoctonia solani]
MEHAWLRCRIECITCGNLACCRYISPPRANSDLSSLVESNFSLFLSTTSLAIESNSSRSARATPVLVIRPPAQPPLDEKDWEPPSALGVCSPEGFKSEQSISQLRPYTPSPAVSTLAPSSVTSSTAATPTVDPSARPEVAQVLERASEALFLHAQRSSESITSESAYSDTDTAPETFGPAEPDDDRPESEKIPEIDLEPKSPELPPEQILSDSAVESLRVERPLSPVGVGLAASSASTVSRDRKMPAVRPSLLGLFSRLTDKFSPPGKDQKDKQAQPIPSSHEPAVQHDSFTHGGSPFTRLRNKSTDKLSILLGVGGDIKPSSSSIRSSRFRLGSRRTNSQSLRTAEKTDSGSGQQPSQIIAQISPPASPVLEARPVSAADADIHAEDISMRSSERGRAIQLRSSAESPNKPLSARSPSEEPIGGEPVLISGDLQSNLELNPVLPESVQYSAENASRDLPTPPRSRSPSLFRKKLRDKRARTGSLRDLLKKSDSTKSKKQERFTPPTPFIAWITQQTHRSPQSEPPLPALPTPLTTPPLSLPPENLSPVIETSPTDTSRILSLVWYPPELIRSPYASDISLSDSRANNPNPAAPFDERDSSIATRLSGLPEPVDEPTSQPNNLFYLQPPFPEAPSHIANASSSTVHAQPISERRSPAKLRRKHRPGNKTNAPRTPPTSYSALSRKRSRGRHESTESVAGSSTGRASTTPSRSLDTLLNSSWPEPPVNQPVKSDGEEEHTYNYLTETGAEDDSDQEEYLPSPTSIGGASTRPTTPKHLRARPRSRSPGDAIRDEHPLPAVIHGAPDDQSGWEPDSRVTSYLSASPTTARTPASPAAKAPPVPPLPQHITPRARQNTGNTSAARPVGIFDSLPFRSPSPGGRPITIASVPPPSSLSATPPRPPVRTASPSPTRASSTPRAPSPVPRVPSGTPILRSPALPRRTTSYQSAASIFQAPERRDSVEEDYFALDDERSAAIPNFPKRRSPTPGRKDLHSTSRRDSGQYSRRSRKDSSRSHRESIKSHRDSIPLRKDSLQAQRRDSPERHDSTDSQNKDQVTSDNQIWTVPRNHRHRPTITFEFPPTNEFWHFLNEYQQYINPASTRGEDNEHGPADNDMSEHRSGSAASGSSKSSRSKVDPVKDWHKVQPTSSRASSSRASIDRTGTPYIPTPEVIERNELIIKALKNAPGALHTRFRHFGQLGVLGWSSEFSELIDEIQRCGLERQMFTTTRAQALSTCKALLRLHIEIRLQMISMFLCSQIARLRRFLDAETEYTDYPTPDFPLPEAY